jgi:tellurium resistance protein TerD
MGISLSKGQGISLSKEAPTMKKVRIGLGWDARVTDGSAYDLDATAFLLSDSGVVTEQPGLVGYMKKSGGNDSVTYLGDNKTGEGEGDDEGLIVDLSAVPMNVSKVAFTVTIHEAIKRNQNFGGIENSFIRAVNEDDGTELARFDLREDFDMETAMIMGELYRHGEEWKFRAIGQGFASGLEGLCEKFGVEVD